MAESNEGSAWFWRIFGGTILGMISFLLLAHINNINSSIDKAKNEAMVAVSLLRQDLCSQREIIDASKDRLLSIENAPYKAKVESLELVFKTLEETVKLLSIESAPYKAKIANLELSFKTLEETVNSRSERIAGTETSITHLKEEIESIKKVNEKFSEQLLALRDRIVALEQKSVIASEQKKESPDK